ncbi:DUF4865 family protein [Streptomyces europaeiscabiei]|uniref:DUF4865 family protein n=1 Tax=Streptomyces europaeiscabiei TaxID=146819 RepID=UPI000765B2D3|nr:DUF4865 family protein [Streptomyces europaeiscabiei]MDX3672153.1 DUF4865 family protein [Streptomyces europaeiscabiei]
MHATQYEITLPADYDMEVVRRRVASRGHALDAWEGLGLKAYLMRERGVHGSPVNQYAPFYLWNSVEGMNSFFWGGGFQGVVDDFGRPSVRQWTGLAYEAGGGADSPARVAVRARRPVPGGVSLGEVVEDAVRGTERLASSDGAVLAAAAVNTSRWEIVHFSVWDHDAPNAEGETFQVLHMSTPERDRLPRGRQW